MEQSLELGQKLAKLIKPPLLIELIGDLGGGKTALVKAIAKGFGIEQTVTSPTFNIHRGYQASNGVKLEHFDLYRLSDDKIVLNILAEKLKDPMAIVCTEWANHFSKLPRADKLLVECYYVSENERRYEISGNSKRTNDIVKGLKK